MSDIKQYYHIILQAGDGTEWKWQVTNNYFKRRMEVINREMLAAIRKHDKENQFTLDNAETRTINPHLESCPWHGVDLDNDDHCDQMDDTPCTCMKDFEITLINIQTMETKTWNGHGSDRYKAVAQAFMDLTGKTQGENLETWKVLEAVELP